jgi:hypothetical protein
LKNSDDGREQENQQPGEMQSRVRGQKHQSDDDAQANAGKTKK